MAEIYKGKSYSLSDAQIKALANICYREQGGGEAGVRACITHMLNYYEKYQTKKYANPYECTIRSGWYGSYEFNKPYLTLNSTPQAVIGYVRDVLNGNRSLPSYIDEYDCLSDIKTATNNGVSFNPEDRTQYKKDVTKITNRRGSSYTFYCFPDGAKGYTDAFGYISKPSTSTTTTIKKATTTTTTKKVTTTTTKNTSLISVSSVIEKAVKWMENLAYDSSHGYDQQYRWGERGDYDCSSAIITSFEQAGIPVKSKGGATYTGNMYNVFIKYGFKDVTSLVNKSTGSGLQRGDVLLNHVKHVAMYCGNGKEVEASINEKGTATGGSPGDQTGKEILIRSYRNFPWDVILRYTGGANVTNSTTTITTTKEPTTQVSLDKVNFTVTEVSYGSTGASTLLVQKLLKAQGYLGSDGKELELDGEAGENTVYAIQHFQSANGLTADGIAGKKTLSLLMKGLV